ncbi:hypothetical protein [Planobispora longispora]|uniref:Uncharacterized protein n=1 Tax=Planobispora longispora TaxID=28887 RepID=A0A8J3RKR7_9ACTN|nr:hypothetical protein [Planobispora longispora]BFE83771.1 hypothetical protein GCM10020093_063720 [Planobispora longispora]GIH78311.1 hypothetical protein Plo01_47400 [Planobispora longispora]
MSSSVFLYLAIVIMWLCVLVPMWLRRDRATFPEPHELAEPYAQPDQPVEGDTLTGEFEVTAEPSAPDDAPETGPQLTAAARQAERRRAELRRRARIVAKRRRLTFWCALLVLASTVTAAAQVIPWWGVAPSVILLVSYLTVLRASVRVDAERRAAAAKARAERARRARLEAQRRAELEARRPAAEVIDLTTVRDEIFDQYADPPVRAVGD